MQISEGTSRDSLPSSAFKLTSPNIKNTSNKNAFLILSMSHLSAGRRDMLCQTTVWIRGWAIGEKHVAIHCQ